MALTARLDDLDTMVAAGTNAQKKHLLHMVVKEVRVQSRGSADLWYALPRSSDPGSEPQLARRVCRYPNRMGLRRAEVWVRVYRVFRPRRGVLAGRTGETGGIGLRPEPGFLPTGLVAPTAYHLPRQPAPRPDRVALARRALVWRALLAVGALPSRAALARWQGLSRARVTQVMRLLATASRARPVC